MNYDMHTGSAMNYYEELGVSQQATEQEIRKAHRRLVKLMHPDAQHDHNLKMLAETQMRRLNSIVSTLIDPEQRRLYDEQLREAELRHHVSDRRGFFGGIPWWLASAVGAVALTLTAVWLWADHLGRSGMRGHRPATVQTVRSLPPSSLQPSRGLPETEINGPVGASYTAPPLNPAMVPQTDQSQHSNSISAAVLPDPPPTAKPSEKPESAGARVDGLSGTRETAVSKSTPVVVKVPAPERKDQPASSATLRTPVNIAAPPLKKEQSGNSKGTAVYSATPRKAFSMPAGSLISQVIPAKAGVSGTLPAPPGVMATPGHDPNSAVISSSSPLPSAVPLPKPPVAIASTAANSRDPLEGEWVYAPKEPERHRAGFYPPEFIDLKIFETGDPGSLKGQYMARYIVTDRPVSPEVSFELASSAKGSRRFVWQSNNGAKGTLNIDPIDEDTIRVDWHTTSAVRGPALTSGQATLVRRQ